MICYRDQTYCCNPDCPGDRHDKYTEEVQQAARDWWGGPGAPVALKDLCNNAGPLVIVAADARGNPEVQS